MKNNQSAAIFQEGHHEAAAAKSREASTRGFNCKRTKQRGKAIYQVKGPDGRAVFKFKNQPSSLRMRSLQRLRNS